MGIKKYKIYNYIIIPLYLFNQSDKVILIYYKIYIINDLFIKIFIDIDIIKFGTIILDIDKNLIIIKSCEFL